MTKRENKPQNKMRPIAFVNFKLFNANFELRTRYLPPMTEITVI